MSTPERVPAPTSSQPDTAEKTRSPRLLRWHQRVLAFCLIVFALELGLFLIVFPWAPLWGSNWVPVHSQFLAPFWMSRYFRGMLSGLGLLNLYVAGAELVRQLRSLFAPQ